MDLQADLAERARGDAYLRTCNIITDDIGDVPTEISKAVGLLAGAVKCGLCVVVLQPVATDVNANMQFGPQDIEVGFHVIELPVLNRDPTIGSYHKALAVARRLIDTFKLYHPQGLAMPLICGKPAILPTRGHPGVEYGPELIAYEVRFMGREGADRRMHKVDRPNITTTGGAITITCPTPSVDIYYTLDGQHPRPANYEGEVVSAQLYEAPFAPPFSAIVRACAYRQQSDTFWIASDTSWAEWDVALADNAGAPLGTAGDTLQPLGA